MQHGQLAGAPRSLSEIAGQRLDLLRAEACAPPEPAVMLELVGTPAKVGDPEDEHLAFMPRQGASGHQTTGEVQPAPEQTAVATQGGEDVWWLGAGHRPR